MNAGAQKIKGAGFELVWNDQRVAGIMECRSRMIYQAKHHKNTQRGVL